ncbi:MAG: EboA domain-containing protein [Pseudomonadota bacterium]
MTVSATDLLMSWIARQASAESLAWLEAQRAKLATGPSDRDLQLAIGLVPRKLGRDDLQLSDQDRAAASAARDGWDPNGWSIDVAARAMLLATAAPGLNAFADRYASLCRYGDVAEQIACYRALPLLPRPAELEPQVGEGLRTNMRAVFEAIAHNNPYPAEQFDEHRWNHMVLKALFIDSTLHPIVGLDRRANTDLARILCDYAHERWAAGRVVTPELWRCVGPFASAAMIDDLIRAADSDDALSKEAAALALRAAPDARAASVLSELPDEAAAAESGALTWTTVAEGLAQRA